MSSKIILFDLGGVLIENNGRQALMAMLSQALPDHQVAERWNDSPAVRLFESGRSSAQEFASAFIEEWQLGLAPACFISSFSGWLGGFFPGVPELLRALRARHRIACLSNTNVLHLARMPDLRSVFDGCFLSHEMGLMKPDREAFEFALNALSVRPQDVWFFDDLLANVSAARALGINSHRVAGFADVEPILKREGLLA
jgi:putative hydrolase of the HAD superfamily